MRKLQYILVILIVACVGCGKDNHGMLTNRGKTICGSWHMGTAIVMEDIINPAFHFNAWLNGNEHVRRAIEDNYFPDLRIRQDGESIYGVYHNAQLLLRINTQGTNIDAEGAQWILTCFYSGSEFSYYGHPYVLPDFTDVKGAKEMTISYLGNYQWGIEAHEDSFDGVNINWTLAAATASTPLDLYSDKFILTGDGSYRFSSLSRWHDEGEQDPTPITMTYTIEHPMYQNFNDILQWSSGQISITASMQDKEDVNVSATVLAPKHIEITYKGITERWEMDFDEYYYSE